MACLFEKVASPRRNCGEEHENSRAQSTAWVVIEPGVTFRELNFP